MKGPNSAAELLIRLDRGVGVPMRLQLEPELRLAIQSGRLRHGTLLPSTRYWQRISGYLEASYERGRS